VRKQAAARGIVGVGEQSATFVVIPLPRAQAQALLPAELTLVPTNVAGEGMHPLICAFGVQRNVHTAFPPSHSDDPREIAAYLTELRLKPEGASLLPLAMTYREVITAIPFVTWTQPNNTCPGPFLWAPRLYLDQPFAIFLGWLVGYAKEYAWITGDMMCAQTVGQNCTQKVVGLNLTRRFSGLANHGSAPGAPAAFPNFGEIRPMLELPVIGKVVEGFFVRTRFYFDFNSARLWPVHAEVTLTANFFHGALPRIAWSVDGIDTQRLGAFCMEVNWQLTDPVACLPH
jgi:hypothetical protein